MFKFFPGLFIIGVLAIDGDSEENADITYSLFDNKDVSNFDINPERGIITAHNDLSSTASPAGYTFRVRAADKVWIYKYILVYLFHCLDGVIKYKCFKI